MPKHEIDICICTFQRDHITKTIHSLGQMAINEEYKIRIIIADNDETPSSKDKVEAAAKTLPFPLTYIHAPARNISIARNACLDKSKSDLVIFIDDDEMVEEQWLIELLECMEQTKADAVIGPVRVIYDETCPHWVSEGDYLSRTAVYVGDEIQTGYTANLLFNKAAPAFKNKRFALELGQSGGEDSVFLNNAYKAGAKIAYAPKAILTEIAPPERTKFKWLLKRRYREGQTHGMMLAQSANKNIVQKAKNIALASAKAACSFIAAPFFICAKHKMNFWLFRGAMHAGAVSYLLGGKALTLYGNDKNET